jgi:NDP-sugar pyrophosphorylase family protein
MIMAAGLGTRLQPFTGIFPKPLAPVMGVPSIQYCFDLLNTTSVKNTMINVHFKAETFLQQVRFLQSSSKLHFSDESSLLLGSGGGIRKVKSFFRDSEGKPEPFFLLNADTICSVPLIDVGKIHQKLRHLYGVEMTLVVFAKSPPGGQYREVLLDERRKLVAGIGELKRESVFYTGISVIEPEAIPDELPVDQPSDFLTQILEPAIRRGKVGYYFFDNSLDQGQRSWFDLGSPELWATTHFRWLELLEEDDLPSLWNTRVRSRNHRVKSCVWSNAPKNSLDVVSGNWAGPAYFGALPTSFDPPKRLGGHQVLYGATPHELPLERGIGYLGLWKSL